MMLRHFNLHTLGCAPPLFPLLSTRQGPLSTPAPLPSQRLKTSSCRSVSSRGTQPRTLLSVFEFPLLQSPFPFSFLSLQPFSNAFRNNPRDPAPLFTPQEI